jgi:hypothetical protein
MANGPLSIPDRSYAELRGIAEHERERAEHERLRAEQLAAQLRELGVISDER